VKLAPSVDRGSLRLLESQSSIFAYLGLSGTNYQSAIAYWDSQYRAVKSSSAAIQLVSKGGHHTASSNRGREPVHQRSFESHQKLDCNRYDATSAGEGFFYHIRQHRM
jgi:hypothetical protein